MTIQIVLFCNFAVTVLLGAALVVLPIVFSHHRKKYLEQKMEEL